MTDFKIAVQLYTLREETARDLPGVLRRVASMGYQGVEFAGLGEHRASDLRAVLDETGLRAAACHVKVPELEADFPGVVEMVRTLGSEFIVCPWVAPETTQDPAAWSAFTDRLEGWAQEARSHGLQFAYHNHAFEFEARHDDHYAFDLLFGGAPGVQVELDVAWAYAGGVDPAAYVRRYAGRLPLLHMKDVQIAGSERRTVELGQGEVPLAGVISEARRAGVEWLIVEQDHTQRDAFDSVQASLGWLQDALGVDQRPS